MNDAISSGNCGLNTVAVHHLTISLKNIDTLNEKQKKLSTAKATNAAFSSLPMGKIGQSLFLEWNDAVLNFTVFN